MHHFIVSQEQVNQEQREIIITGKDYHHMKQVLRMKTGEELTISAFDSQMEYTCEVKEYLEDQALVTIRYVQENQVELPCKIYLFQGLPKSDKMEFIIQKAVELGVYEVIPVATKRSIVKLDPKKANTKVQRWQTIATAAAKQSKRGVIPAVGEVLSFAKAIERAKHMDVKLIPYELATDSGVTRTCIESIQSGESVGIFIGPEGGFSEEEIALALECGLTPITLGKRILRTETAGMTVLSFIMYQLEIKGCSS